MSGSKLIQVFQLAQLATAGLADPVQASSVLSKIKSQATLLAKMLSNEKRRYVNAPVDRAADVILVPDNLGTITHGGAASAPITFKMPSVGGMVLWMAVAVQEGTDIGVCSMAMDVKTLDGKNPLGVNGAGAAFIPFPCFSPRNAPAMPLGVRVRGSAQWSFSFTNKHASIDYTPLIAMGFAEEGAND